jgi:hypothetical protein
MIKYTTETDRGLMRDTIKASIAGLQESMVKNSKAGLINSMRSDYAEIQLLYKELRKWL